MKAETKAAIDPLPRRSVLRAEQQGGGVRIVFPEYPRDGWITRCVFYPLAYGPLLPLLPVVCLLKRLAVIAPPPARLRHHVEAQVSGGEFTFRHWFGEEVWHLASVRDVVVEEAGGDGSEFEAVRLLMSGSPIRSSERVKGYHDLYVNEGKRQLNYNELSRAEVKWLARTMRVSVGLPVAPESWN